MEHIGSLGHAEPISFGIEQILSHAEQSCMLGARTHNAEYGHTAAYCGGGGAVSASGGFTCANTVYNGSGGGGACGAYVNMGMNVTTNNVIRVPAHRPLSGGPPGPHAPSSGHSALTFPWMESNRRYTKDRFTDLKLSWTRETAETMPSTV